jgi:hypothetical protein
MSKVVETQDVVGNGYGRCTERGAQELPYFPADGETDMFWNQGAYSCPLPLSCYPSRVGLFRLQSLSCVCVLQGKRFPFPYDSLPWSPGRVARTLWT